MPIYHTLGSIPRKRHTAFRKPNGGIYAEELMGHEGFTGTSSLLYHVHPPTTIKSAKRIRDMKFVADEDQTIGLCSFIRELLTPNIYVGDFDIVQRPTGNGNRAGDTRSTVKGRIKTAEWEG